MEFGSVAWARHTGGAVVGREHLRQTAQLVRYQIMDRLPRLRRTLDLRGDAQVDTALEQIRLPETETVSRCLTLIDQLGPPALVQHTLRTHAFGTLLGLRDGLSWDREVFAIAALLHDLGLARRDQSRTCFAHDGAEQASDLLARQGFDDDRTRTVADAICLHLRVTVPPELGVEAHLVHAGAGLDVVGARMSELDDATLHVVLAQHDRTGFVDTFSEFMRSERRRHPTARASRWMALGFERYIRVNPLRRLPR